MRPALYRAADALDSTGGARDLADSLYADLFGSLFGYYHGRSSLTTWLRAVLAQRYVDRLRAGRRAEPLPEEDSAMALRAPTRPVEPNRDRDLELMRAALKRATAALPARDRLRLACYYAQELTLAQTGKLLGEHEATVSRGLARTRAAIRKAVEHDLAEAGLKEAEIARCFESVSEDAGPLNVHDLLDTDTAASARKETVTDRST
jgi:RNA polymerase sigma factor (sigma-70 family)